jgi:hypothetical protein
MPRAAPPTRPEQRAGDATALTYSPVCRGGRCDSSVEATKRCRLITAIKTPYLKDGRFDLTAYDKLVETQIDCGVEVRALVLEDKS